MKVQPFYSSNVSDPDVYHDQKTCPAGQMIPLKNKKFGTNGYRHCRSCASITS